MLQTALLILSPDKDFAETLAEQVRGELKIPCTVGAGESEIKQYLDGALGVVATMQPEESLPCPLILVKERPVRLRDLLDDIGKLLQNHSSGDIVFGEGYSLQIRLKQVSLGDKSVALTDTEVKLLQSLIEMKGQVAHKDRLLKNVWGFDEALDTHTLETHIYRLRGKLRELDEDNEMIAATEGGYMLNAK